MIRYFALVIQFYIVTFKDLFHLLFRFLTDPFSVLLVQCRNQNACLTCNLSRPRMATKLNVLKRAHIVSFFNHSVLVTTFF